MLRNVMPSENVRLHGPNSPTSAIFINKDRGISRNEDKNLHFSLIFSSSFDFLTYLFKSESKPNLNSNDLEKSFENLLSVVLVALELEGAGDLASEPS